MPFPSQRRSFLAIATVVIFVAGAGAGVWRFHQAKQSAFAALIVKANRCSIAFDAATLRQLSGTRADVSTPLYAQIKERLARLRNVESTIRSVYIFRYVPSTGKIIFLADSESNDSPQLSLPGDEYREAPQSPGLEAIVANGESVTEGPINVAQGSSVRAYASIGAAAAGEPRHILGLDLSANDWRHSLWSAAFGTAGYVWLFLVLPLVALVSTRRQLLQRDALRNLTEAMEQGQSAVIVVDLELRVEYANSGFCRQFGYTRRELIGREWRELQSLDTDVEFVADLVTTMRAGRAWKGEWAMLRKDGSSLPVRGSVTPVKNRAGETRSYVAVFEDVTEIRKAESEMREAKERAEAGDRAKGQFLATMSHEVRTPLNGIVGFASLLLDTELTPEQQEYVDTIRTSSETLIQLTGDILDYARIESGRLKLEPQPCDPRECVESALDLVAAPAVKKNIELLHWVDEDVPGAVVADVSRLRQVVVNLVNNAVKFTADGEVEVRLRTLASAPASAKPLADAGPRCVLEFSVRDTGIGIAAEHHAKIFRPFSQVDDSTTRRFGGTGLGLAICKNIVELMDGGISFASEPGHGSTFTFYVRLPVAQGPARPVPPLTGQRLAIVTQHAGLGAELVRLAGRFGAQPWETDLAVLAASPAWDLAITDITGPRAMELVARSTPRPGLPADKMIALVPIALPGELRSGLRDHFKLVVNKPVHHDMLESLLGAQPAGPAGSASPANGEAASFALDVLIVEDNAVNQRLIQKVVAKLGCRFTTAENGRVALEQLSRAAAHVVLMDLHMPELDGLSAIGKIRSGEAGPAARDVWIIALTADAREEQRERTLSAGANDYLTKPVRLPELTAALQRFRAQRP
jgi:PAS domain S-box-containing protein